MEYFAIFTVCAISGVFTGLLGIGGGLIIVPAFLSILPLFGVKHFSLHEIIGISATCVFFNSLSSLYYRRKEKFLPEKLMTKLLIFIMVGTAIGAYYSSFAPYKLLLLIYIVVCVISGFLLKKDIRIEIKNKTLMFALYISFAGIGALGASIGIGGAILFTTALKCFLEKSTKELLPSVTLIVAIHAMVAFGVKLYNNDVTLMIVPIAILSSLVGAKIGVTISRKLSSNAISNLMIITLVVALTRVTIEFFKP